MGEQIEDPNPPKIVREPIPDIACSAQTCSEIWLDVRAPFDQLDELPERPGVEMLFYAPTSRSEHP